MSENKNIQNEQELWDVLSEPVTTEPKAEKTGKFLKPKAEPAQTAAPVAKTAPVAEAAAEAPKSGRKIDGFFVACMAGVAAVSVAATLVVSSMFGGSTGTGAPSILPAVDGNETVSSAMADLERENAELRAQLEQQKEQIKDLQSDLITLMGSEEFFATASTDPDENNEVLTAQMQALDTFAQIQEAYADFDRERLEELIPQMDEQLGYLTPEALNNYYLILEYVEQPSNG